MAVDDDPRRVELSLLGGLELRRDGVLVTGFRSRKALLLLAYLAVRRTPQARAWLAELLWPRASSTQGRVELARVLNDVKSRVGPVFAADRERVGLLPGALADDLTPLRAAEESRDAAAAAAVVAREPGPFLAGVDAAEPEVAQWVDDQRRDVEVLVAGLLERLCRTATEDEAALTWARRWVAHDPTVEESNRAVIELLARTGRPAAALAHYAVLEERLTRELGVRPEPRTRALVAAVRKTLAETAVPPLELPPLPLAWTPLLGRDALVEEVSRRLATGHTRLVTLTGAGGIGKTRVGLEAARWHRAAGFFDAVGFVDLSAVRQAALVDDAVRRQLGLVAGPDLRLALRRQLGPGRILLVLDNVEQIDGIAEHVLGLLTDLPRLVLLTTSRGTLQLVGEHLVEVPTLDLDDAVVLFRQQAEAGGVSRRLAEEDSTGEGVRTVCHQLGGLPLAVELAAVGLRTLDLAQLIRRLVRDGDGVAAREWNRPARHRTVHDAVRWSVDLLTPQHQQLFAWTAAFVAPVRSARFAELAGVPVTEADGALRAMGAVGLVRPVRDPDDAGQSAAPAVSRAAFGSLSLVRSVAARDLQVSGVEPVAHRRHAETYFRLAQGSGRRGRDADGSDQIERILTLEDEIDEVRIALERAADRSVAELARWCVELRIFWSVCGHTAEAVGWAERVLASPDGLDPGTRAWVALLSASESQRAGDLDRSLELCRQLTSFVDSHPKHELAVFSLSMNAANALFAGRVEEALRQGEHAVAVADRRGVLEIQLAERSLLGFVAEMLGQGDRATEAARTGVELSLQHGDIHWRPSLQSVLARRLLVSGDPAGAATLYADALDLLARTRDTYVYRPCLIGGAEVAAALGRAPESARLVGAVVALDSAIGTVTGTWAAVRDRLSVELPGRLGPSAYAEEVAAGRRLTPDQAARLVRAVSTPTERPGS